MYNTQKGLALSNFDPITPAVNIDMFICDGSSLHDYSMHWIYHCCKVYNCVVQLYSAVHFFTFFWLANLVPRRYFDAFAGPCSFPEMCDGGIASWRVMRGYILGCNLFANMPSYTAPPLMSRRRTVTDVVLVVAEKKFGWTVSLPSRPCCQWHLLSH